jgi:hypothetical protein
MTKDELYQLGVQAAQEFLRVNNLTLPYFLTYAEALRVNDFAPDTVKATIFLRRAGGIGGLTVGSGTGLYYDKHIFVNVPRTASPVARPAYRSWSWPGWKTDRTAVGVVAHEVGHYVEHRLQLDGKLDPKMHGLAWRALVAKYKKTVSGYEPVPSEAWAETMRLFILNPDLLQRALPQRYGFILGVGLLPIERLLRKGYAKILKNEAYITAAERWIG